MQYILHIYRKYIHIYIEYTIRLLHINSLLYINLFYILYFSIFFFLLFTTFVSLFALFLSWLSSLVLFCLVSVVFNLLVSLMVSFAHRVTLLYFVFFGLFWFCVCVCSFVSVTICLILNLPFVWGSFLCVFVLILFIAITNSLWDPGSLMRDWA